MLRGLILAAAVLALAGGAAAAPTRVENRVAGHLLTLPAGWTLVVEADGGASVVSTYRVRRVADVGERPPRHETSVRLHDEGPLWALPAWARVAPALPRRLPAESTFEGYGPTRYVHFRASGHLWSAWVKGAPRESATLGILRSIRLTPRGRSLALVITSRVEDGVRLWRVGNPRSPRRIVVVGCADSPCPGLAVTQRLVNGVRPLAADLRVIQLLSGREDVLARLIRRTHPEAVVRLGAVRDPDRWARAIAALAQ